MSTDNTRKSGGAMKKGVAYWKTNWMKKVLSNGHNAQAKLVFMRIASFGESGCWMNNETFGEEFNRDERTIRRAVSSLAVKGDIIVLGWDGHGRKMYASGHPQVAPTLNLKFMQAKKAGKVKTIEEFREKFRIRPPQK